MNRIISNSVCNHCRLGIAQTSLALHSAKSFILITVFTVLTHIAAVFDKNLKIPNEILDFGSFQPIT